MITDKTLDEAIAHGILTAEQVARLRGLAETAQEQSEDSGEPIANPDDERFRLIGGFNDVFVTIGVILLVAAIFALASVVDFRPGFAVLAMASAWGLSEYFSRRLRLALPSIALALMFAGAAGFAVLSLGGWLLQLGGAEGDVSWNRGVLLFGIGTTLAAVVHEHRFRVPVDWAIAAVGMTWAVWGALAIALPDWANTAGVSILLGLAIFAVGLRVDASDPARTTRRADIAFWLHLVAAPMIVHAVMPSLPGGDVDGLRAAFALLVFAALGLVAIVIDRRALLVSGLLYAGVAIGYFLTSNVTERVGPALTLLCLAALVLGLSAGWRSLRRAIVPRLPLGRLSASIPPPT